MQSKLDCMLQKFESLYFAECKSLNWRGFDFMLGSACANVVKISSAYCFFSLQILSILLRPSEMEFDDTRLRKCRVKLKKHQLALTKMVRQQRHWQSRFMSKEAHEQWWKSPPEKPPMKNK